MGQLMLYKYEEGKLIYHVPYVSKLFLKMYGQFFGTLVLIIDCISSYSKYISHTKAITVLNFIMLTV